MVVVRSSTHADPLPTAIQQFASLQNCVLAEPGHYNPPMPIEDLAKHGCQSYLRELFTAPDAVVRYLCRNGQVHQIPVGNDKTERAAEALVNDPAFPFMKFFTPRNSYQTNVSRYDKASRSTRVMGLRAPMYLKDSVDSGRLSELQRASKTLQRELEQLRAQKQEHDARTKVARVEESNIEASIADLKNRKTKRSRLQAKIRGAESRIANFTQALADSQQRLKAAQSGTGAVEAKQAALLLQMAGAAQRVAQASSRCLRLLVDVCEAARVVEARTAEHEEATRNLKAVKASLLQLKGEVDRSKGDAKSLLAQAKAETKVDKPTDAMDQAFQELPGDLESLVARMHEEQAKMDCNVDVDEGLVREYRLREVEIEEAQADLTQGSVACEELVNDIEKVKTEWLPPLKAIIHKISESYSGYFKELGCAGEIHLHESEVRRCCPAVATVWPMRLGACRATAALCIRHAAALCIRHASAPEPVVREP